MNDDDYNDLELKELINHSLIQQELKFDAKRQRNAICSQLIVDQITKVNTHFKYKNVHRPFDKLVFKQGSDLLESD